MGILDAGPVSYAPAGWMSFSAALLKGIQDKKQDDYAKQQTLDEINRRAAQQTVENKQKQQQIDDTQSYQSGQNSNTSNKNLFDYVTEIAKAKAAGQTAYATTLANGFGEFAKDQPPEAVRAYGKMIESVMGQADNSLTAPVPLPSGVQGYMGGAAPPASGQPQSTADMLNAAIAGNPTQRPPFAPSVAPPGAPLSLDDPRHPINMAIAKTAAPMVDASGNPNVAALGGRAYVPPPNAPAAVAPSSTADMLNAAITKGQPAPPSMGDIPYSSATRADTVVGTGLKTAQTDEAKATTKKTLEEALQIAPDSKSKRTLEGAQTGESNALARLYGAQAPEVAPDAKSKRTFEDRSGRADLTRAAADARNADTEAARVKAAAVAAAAKKDPYISSQVARLKAAQSLVDKADARKVAAMGNDKMGAGPLDDIIKAENANIRAGQAEIQRLQADINARMNKSTPVDPTSDPNYDIVQGPNGPVKVRKPNAGNYANLTAAQRMQLLLKQQGTK